MTGLDATDWTENVASPMAAVEFARFQASLDSIVGLEADGTPRLRLVWGQDLRTTETWDRYQKLYRPRYAHRRVRRDVISPSTGLIEPRYDWIGVPRYFIEAYVPRLHLNPLEEKAGADPDGDTYAEARTVGGIYVTATPILEHSQVIGEGGWRICCLEAVRLGRKCWGRYREPDQFDLDTVRQGLAERQQAGVSRPDAPSTEADKMLGYYQWLAGWMKQQNRAATEREYIRRHELNTLRHWWDYGPRVKGHVSLPICNN